MTETSQRLLWYAFKVFFNQEFKVEEELAEKGVEVFIPSETVNVKRGKANKKVRKPMIAGLLFCRTTEHNIQDLVKELYGRASIYKNINRAPAVISEREMNIFRLVTTSGELDLEFYPEGELNYHVGNRVRVIDGPFKGAEGYIRRIKGNNRLIVSVSGVCAVATTYIPRVFLEKIEEC